MGRLDQGDLVAHCAIAIIVTAIAGHGIKDPVKGVDPTGRLERRGPVDLHSIRKAEVHIAIGAPADMVNRVRAQGNNDMDRHIGTISNEVVSRNKVSAVIMATAVASGPSMVPIARNRVAQPRPAQVLGLAAKFQGSLNACLGRRSRLRLRL
jgi:hypothetical protein